MRRQPIHTVFNGRSPVWLCGVRCALPAQPIWDFFGRLRNRAAPSAAAPAISRRPASPAGSDWSEPVAANDVVVADEVTGLAGVGTGVVVGFAGVTALDA